MTRDTDDFEVRQAAGPIAVACLILFALVAGVIAWLYFYGGEQGLIAQIPHATAKIPAMPGTAPTETTGPTEPGAALIPQPEAQPAQPEAQAQVPPPEAAKPEPLPAAAPEPKPAEAMAPEPKPVEVKTAEIHPPKPAAGKHPEPAKETKAPKPAPSEAPPEEPPATTTNLAALPEPKLAPTDPALLEHGRQGPLPIIGPDGRQPWKVYARPFDDSDKRPRIAVVVTDLGLSGAATETAIQQLPGSVTLAFSPYAKGLEQWMNLARAAGHEVLIDLPMEPMDYPQQDPGPYTLLTSIDPKQNLFKMEWLLSRGTGYVGVTNRMGSRFTTSGKDLSPVIGAMKVRGLLFLDSRSTDQSLAAKMASDAGMAWAYNNRFIDSEASRDAIDRQLADVEAVARKTGFAIAMGTSYPVTMERVAAWVPKAEKDGFAIAPVSAIAGKQSLK